jgi:hypothetical protein
MRYHLWTMIAALIAAVLSIADLMAGQRVARTRLMLAGTPVVLIALLCLASRIA